MKCSQCDSVRINGTACHETGCPLSHIDLDTGKPYAVECDNCGSEFIPEGGQRFCGPCCSASYFGHACECEHCQEFRDDMDNAE